MKRMMVIAAALALAPLGCVANQGDAPVRFLNALGLKAPTEPGASCSADTAVGVSSGTFDISGGQNFVMALAVETNTSSQPITIGGEGFSGSGLSDVTLNELVYSYESSGNLTLPADEEDRTPIYAVFRPQTDPTSSYLMLWGFGAKGFAALKSLPVSPTDSVTVLVTIKARGKLSGGQSVESNEITFPVTVFNTGYVPSTNSCPSGKPPLAGPCGPGQGVTICQP